MTVQRPSTRAPWRKTAMVTGLLVASLGMAACSSETPEPVTVTETATVTATPEPVVAPDPEVTEETEEPVAAAPTRVAKVEVPDGVGLNYQLAQDLWRAAGLFVMPANDALGLNRMAWLDENWVVVSQSPAAGKKVADGSDITATIKKFSD